MIKSNISKLILLLLFVFVCVLAGRPHYPINVVSAVLIHETGHLAVAKLCRVKLENVDYTPLGIRMKYDFTAVSVWREVLVCLGGSTAGIVSAIAAILTGLTDSDAGISFVLTSLTLSVMNLMPIRGFDGGEIVESLLSVTLLPDRAYPIAGHISRAAVLLFWIITLRVEMKVGINLSMLVLSVYLIYSSF